TTPDKALSRGLGMAICPQHLLLSRRLLRYPWTPQMVSDPRVHDLEGRLDCRGLHAYGLGAAGPDVCHSGPASVGVGVCGHHGVRIEVHAFHSDHIFWGGVGETMNSIGGRLASGQKIVDELCSAQDQPGMSKLGGSAKD